MTDPVLEEQRQYYRARAPEYDDWWYRRDRAPAVDDLVFFGFWLTHVPDDRFDDFWATVDRHLVPGGRVFMLDNAHLDSAGRLSSAGEIHTVSAGTSQDDLAGGTAVRTLADGRPFEIVKRFWHPDELLDRLAGLGWRADMQSTERFFVHAIVERA